MGDFSLCFDRGRPFLGDRLEDLPNAGDVSITPASDIEGPTPSNDPKLL